MVSLHPPQPNSVTREGSRIVKRHYRVPGLYELAVLARIGDLPVPRVLAGTRPDALHLEYVDGILATEAIEAGYGSSVLRAMGEALRSIHAVPMSRFGAVKEGDVLSHGDFAPYNVIVSPDGETIRAVLDWEQACLQVPIVDIAWCVMQFRRLFPRYEYAVPHLFEGYGQSFSQPALEEAARRYQGVLSQGGYARVTWPTINFQAMSFGDRREGAAFIAAVSRAAGAPFRAVPYDPPAEIWAVPQSLGGLQVLLNEPAGAVASAVFGATMTAVVRSLPEDARLAFLATHIPASGTDDVLAIL